MQVAQSITARQASALRKRNARHEAWAAQFKRPNGWTIIPKEAQASCPRNARMTNEQRSALEVYDIRKDKPERLFLYLKVDPSPRFASDTGTAIAATTFTGDVVGNGTRGQPYRSGFGDKRRSVWVRIDGTDYHGTAYESAGDYMRLRRVKS